MKTLIILLFGILFGFSLKKISNLTKSIKLPEKKNFKIRFHVYYCIHQSEKKLNDLIKTEPIELSVTAHNEEEVMSLIHDIINNEARIEVEYLKPFQ